MKLAIICFTRNGYEKMNELNNVLGSEYRIERYCKCSALENQCDCTYVSEKIDVWAKEQFDRKNAILFIGATGIAVRAIAGCVADKLTDSPVLVMDDNGQFIIPILSGHVGGANELAVALAAAVAAVPVITTATDVNDKFAVDMFAKENDLAIINREGIAKVSSKALEGKVITMAIQPEYARKVDVFVGEPCGNIEASLYLIPKNLVVGIGCRRGKSKEEIEAFLLKQFEKEALDIKQIKKIVSIDVKKDEEGLILLAAALKVPFETFSADELNQLPGEFSKSEFVKEQVGVDCVSERSAMAGCAGAGELILRKQAENGVTLAIARTEWSLANE